MIDLAIVRALCSRVQINLHDQSAEVPKCKYLEWQVANVILRIDMYNWSADNLPLQLHRTDPLYSFIFHSDTNIQRLQTAQRFMKVFRHFWERFCVHIIRNILEFHYRYNETRLWLYWWDLKGTWECKGKKILIDSLESSKYLNSMLISHNS